MDKTAEDLKDRTKRFAIAVLEFAETLARSHVEFTARLGVVLEEADESELWLDVCQTKVMGDETKRGLLLLESRELVAIFSKACVTARHNDRVHQRSPRQRER